MLIASRTIVMTKIFHFVYNIAVKQVLYKLKILLCFLGIFNGIS